MAQPVNVNFKLDADVKKRMEWACSELGLSMSAAFTIFAAILKPHRYGWTIPPLPNSLRIKASVPVTIGLALSWDFP